MSHTPGRLRERPITQTSLGVIGLGVWKIIGPAIIAKATGVDVDTARQQIVASQGGFATGRFTRPDEVAEKEMSSSLGLRFNHFTVAHQKSV